MADPGHDATHGYADLTPDAVLDALDAVGFRGDGRILQLNSYENRVFQVLLEDGDAVVAKFYRRARWSDAQIVEEHSFALELAEAEVPVVAPCLLRHRQRRAPAAGNRARHAGIAPAAGGLHRYSISPRRAGRAPELEDDAVLVRLGGFIGRLHAVGARRPFAHRRTLDAPRDAREAVALLLDGGFVSDNQREGWAEACTLAIDCIDAAFTVHAPAAIRLHGDCHPGNLLWRDSGAHVVDLDDACMGPAVQDLWMLLSGEPETMAAQLRQLLHGYAPFMDFDRRELQLVEPLRAAAHGPPQRLGGAALGRPGLPAALPRSSAAQAYWGQQATQLREQMRRGRRNAQSGDAAVEPQAASNAFTRFTYAAGSSSRPPSASRAWSNSTCVPDRRSEQYLSFELSTIAPAR
jgi:Ser/Thr protein kinase RdoA (MazF antagonist)